MKGERDLKAILPESFDIVGIRAGPAEEGSLEFKRQ
jgi:hypothetical protein